MTGTHPYAGPALEEALENLDFLEIPELDYACGSNLPWIGDCEDNSNACECKIPHELIFSGDILEYFERTFGRQGRTRRTMRTTMPEWAYVLAKEPGQDHSLSPLRDGLCRGGCGGFAAPMPLV